MKKLLYVGLSTVLAILLVIILSIFVYRISNHFKYKNKNFVFKIQNMDANVIGTGFRINYNNNSYIITNAHLCLTSKEVFISKDDKFIYKAKIIKTDNDIDLCLLESDELKNGYSIPIKEKVNIYSNLVSIGYPKGDIFEVHYGKFTLLEYVSIEYKRNKEPKIELAFKAYCGSLGRTFIIHKCTDNKCEFTESCCSSIRYINLTNIYAVPGSSGSPVLNDKDELAGIISTTNDENKGGMIPLKDIICFLKE